MAQTVTVDFSKMFKKFQNLQDAINIEGPKILEQASKVGETEMKRIINVSSTDWGVERMSKSPPQGKSTGRRDTDTMYQAVTSKVTQLRAEWGWVDGYQEYFSVQEALHGMYSLRNSKQKVLQEMPRLVKNAKARIRYRVRKNNQ